MATVGRKWRTFHFSISIIYENDTHPQNIHVLHTHTYVHYKYMHNAWWLTSWLWLSGWMVSSRSLPRTNAIFAMMATIPIWYKNRELIPIPLFLRVRPLASTYISLYFTNVFFMRNSRIKFEFITHISSTAITCWKVGKFRNIFRLKTGTSEFITNHVLNWGLNTDIDNILLGCWHNIQSTKHSVARSARLHTYTHA